MRLRRLRIRSLPGITSEFTLEAKPGLNLVVGPNGSGKSSILRAVFAVLWPRHASPSPLDVESWWQLGKRRFHGTRYGSGPTRWPAVTAWACWIFSRPMPVAPTPPWPPGSGT